MTCLPSVVLSTTHLDDCDFFSTTVAYYFRSDRTPIDKGCSNLNVFTLSNHHDFIKIDCFTFGCV